MLGLSCRLPRIGLIWFMRVTGLGPSVSLTSWMTERPPSLEPLSWYREGNCGGGGIGSSSSFRMENWLRGVDWLGERDRYSPSRERTDAALLRGVFGGGGGGMWSSGT